MCFCTHLELNTLDFIETKLALKTGAVWDRMMYTSSMFSLIFFLTP